MPSPLLSANHPLPFDAVVAEDVCPSLTTLTQAAKARIAALAANPAPVDFDNCLGELERATESLEIATAIVEHLESVATTPEFRKAYNESLPVTTAFWTEIPLDAALYRRVRQLGERAKELSLSPVEQRLLTKTLEEFKRHGAELDTAGKARLSALDEELSRLTAQFSQHVVDATGAWECVLEDASRLAGLPSTALELLQQNAKAKGMTGYRLTLQTPCVIAVLTYAEERALREQLWRANDGRCRSGVHDNVELISRIVVLRTEKAKLLGYENFGDLVMADRMAKCSKEARRFIDDLTARTRDAFAREAKELDAFAAEVDGPGVLPLMPWDVGYYAEKMRKQRYDFDEEVLRAYFPAEQMLEAVFQTTSELFGLRIEPIADLPTWEPQVRTFSIADADGTPLGVFYVDWYPRENKNQGAWMHGLVSGATNVAVIAANATPPGEGRPSLLDHREVETLWHEFGHLLHHCLSRVPLRSLAGTRVAHDFVELPSQILENFCWEPVVLKRFARHYQTGETIPDELIERLRATRTFRAASAQMRQLGFATLDLALHCDYVPGGAKGVLEFAREVQQQFTPAPLPGDYAMVTAFTHLFAHPVGYATGYYSYKWAEVLDADAYGRFAEDGVTSARVGREFRTKILEVGDARDPGVIYEQFRGRPPTTDALLRRLGLV